MITQQPSTAIKGFCACRIEPFNPHIFRYSDFAPATTSERKYKPSVDVSDNTNNDKIGREIINEYANSLDPSVESNKKPGFVYTYKK